MIQPRLHTRLQAVHNAIPRYTIIRMYDIRIGEAGDVEISESHKCIKFISLYGSSVNFFYGWPS